MIDKDGGNQENRNPESVNQKNRNPEKGGQETVPRNTRGR
jgi:hypothetical protein